MKQPLRPRGRSVPVVAAKKSAITSVMRIPSQFNQDNLYRRGRRRGDLQPHRRMVQLLLALALVLVLMQQASNPKLYESFFGALTAEHEDHTAEPPAHVQTADANAASLPRQAIAPPVPDVELTSQVVDGSVWRQGDFAAMFSFLQEAEGDAPAAGSAVGVLPLLQQPEVYRNQVVRCRGQVVRAQRIEATGNDFGIDQYWQLWLRPQAGADRPLVVITGSVPDAVAMVDATGIDRDGPDILVAGRFLKRLAYQSAAGADLAPVIVGRIITSTVSPPVGLGASTTYSVSKLIAIVAAASVLGIAIAAWVMWRTSVATRQLRKLRSPQQVRL